MIFLVSSRITGVRDASVWLGFSILAGMAEVIGATCVCNWIFLSYLEDNFIFSGN